MADQQGVRQAEANPADEKTKKVKRPRGRVEVYENWCKGCGLCIAFCPTKVLEANGDGRPVVVHPERCTACHWCDTHCPDFAIVVEDLFVQTDDEGGKV